MDGTRAARYPTPYELHKACVVIFGKFKFQSHTNNDLKVAL